MHHITQQASDAGVVYCEMEQIENSAKSILMRNMLQKIYPGNCGYKFEIGGLLKNLRESITNKKVNLSNTDLQVNNFYCLLL